MMHCAKMSSNFKQGDFEDWDKLDAYIALIKKRKIKTPVGFKELSNFSYTHSCKQGAH